MLKKNQINLNILKNKELIKKNVQSEARRIRYSLLTNFCKKRRIKPKKNRLVIWPAHYTHVHRGLQPLSGNKYILTGWTEYSY